MDGPLDPKPEAPVYVANPRWVMVCATLAVGTILLMDKPARGHVLESGAGVACMWAAAPAVPVAVTAPPAIADPTLSVGSPPPSRCSESVTTVTYQTVRRTARARWGGLYGP
jgi:hypothetical protein